MNLMKMLKPFFNFVFRHKVSKNQKTEKKAEKYISASFLLERFLHDLLKHFTGSVEVERYFLCDIVVGHRVQFLLNEHSLSSARAADQHDGTLLLEEQIQEVTDSYSFCCGHQCRLQGDISIEFKFRHLIYKIVLKQC